MSFLDRLRGLKNRTRKKAAKRRVKQKAAADAKRRERKRVARGDDPRTKRGAVLATKRELAGIGSGVKEYAETFPGSSRATSLFGRAKDRTKQALEEVDRDSIEAEDGWLKRAEDVATAGPAVEAELDPSPPPGGMEELATGTLDDDRNRTEGFDMESFVVGEESEDMEPLEFEDSFALSFEENDDDDDSWGLL